MKGVLIIGEIRYFLWGFKENSHSQKQSQSLTVNEPTLF